jgi:DHA1 family bicyclomycin/chloramphenicol resistance-like MFS transporter
MSRPRRSPAAAAEDGPLFAAVVLLVGSIIRVGASIYLPAMPLIGEKLAIDRAQMSHTLTVYFVVFASCIVVAGMLSDAYGRRPVLLAGMVFFILGSAVCATAHGYAPLIAGRALQAFGASMIPGTLIAMVRDACSDLRVVSLIGWLAVLGGLCLVGAPMLGGLLTSALGWRANFWFLVFFTLAVLVVTWLQVPETHPEEVRIPLHPGKTLALTGSMLTSSAFLLVLLPVIAFFALQGAFLAAAPYIVMNGYGLSPAAFGASNIVIVIGLFSGRGFGTWLFRRWGGVKVYRCGGLAALVAGLAFLGLGQGWFSGLWGFLLVAGLFAAVFGILAPVGMKSSVTAFRTHSGVAAALQGALLLGASALGSAAVGLLLKHFPGLGVEAVFALVSGPLCLLAAVTAGWSRPV